MSESQDLSVRPEEPLSADTQENGSANVTGNASDDQPPNEKKLGQLTFDDFENIKRVENAPNMSSHSMGLRRSKRVPQQKSKQDVADIMEQEAEAEAARKRKAQSTAKAKARARERERERYRAKVAAMKKNEASGNTTSKKPANGPTTSSAAPENQEPPLTNDNWSPNMPLLSSDFKTHHSVISRLKNPNMKPVLYAGDVMKVMGFVNKFYQFFDTDVLNLSFQNFEVGLDLYPGGPVGEVIGIYDETKQRTLLYQDYLPIKDVVSSQDKMNLLFLTLLKLTFSQSKAGELQKSHQPLTNLDQMKAQKKPFTMLVRQLRNSARTWGYPKEWRMNDIDKEEFFQPKSKLFENDEIEESVDPKMSEILTPNIYQWHHHEPVPLEEDPLQSSELEKDGILALNPRDRIILLRAMVDWCGSQSPRIRNEIYHLSHTKRDPAFGVQTQHAPRYLVEGSAVTYAQFRKLCSIVQSRYEIRSKKKHVKKQLSNGKKEDLSIKLKILEEIKQTLKDMPKEEKDQTMINLYEKWEKLFEGELPDNPLSNPFEDEVYKLRQQEFFIGRVPHIGDFYLPRLHTYPDEGIISTYMNVRNLKSMHDKYANGEIDSLALFEKNGQIMSTQFKVLYHDTISLIRDTAQGQPTLGKTYWYEMCHDTKTLKEFLEFLDCKIVVGENQGKDSQPGELSENGLPSEEVKDESKDEAKDGSKDEAQDDPKDEAKDESKDEAKDESKDESRDEKGKSGTNSILNKNPLPKESRFNPARNKLRFLKDYLSEMYDILKVFEDLREQYGDTKPSQRLLRRSQRRNVSYGFDSDAEEADVDMGEEYVDEEKNVEYDDDDDAALDYEDDYQDADEEESRGTRKRGRPGRPPKQTRSVRRNTRRR
ncbi:ZYRO0E05610p [Zygosaccharomyces rouxii]|uniref:ZYRO0E05610p n=1 Tax=Zygosaccharomyces rouxii (strain ATCC 2623 / CBS 732 / NBRC 1130 / NCYC 568 / NRRL Y-229) TaxID=559307 RepID=C5E4F8_ZYGRC|nr:uncharacterized protein ZYRO0E05610g [Zygosaccharomyces rouxii]KAH9198223.1 hypothetical protein LQ764DRAFT_155299 [Zygosaccharomyces rouxii]CAR30919.1 ZYRO0E05610p [Zygosaccharomyces rouxii]